VFCYVSMCALPGKAIPDMAYTVSGNVKSLLIHSVSLIAVVQRRQGQNF